MSFRDGSGDVGWHIIGITPLPRNSTGFFFQRTRVFATWRMEQRLALFPALVCFGIMEMGASEAQLQPS